MKTGHGARGVVTYARQAQQFIDVRRYLAFANGRRALPQAQRAPRVAQLAPGAQDLRPGCLLYTSDAADE